MTQHNMLTPLRRWLVQPGSLEKAIAIVVLAILMAAMALVTLHNEAITDRTDMDDIENAAHVAS